MQLKPLLGIILTGILYPIFRFYKPSLNVGTLRINTDVDFISAQTRAALFLGLLERAERRMIKKHLISNVPTIELGASLGTVTREIIKKVGENTPITSIEANPTLAKWLETQVRTAEREHHEVLNLAITGNSKESFVGIKIDRNHLGSHTESYLSEDQIYVPRRSLSEVIRSTNYDVYSIVCDIEGAEYSIFQDTIPELSKCQILIIELHPPSGPQFDELLQTLAKYSLRLIDKDQAVFVFSRL